MKLINSNDIDKAYALGFECIGHPTEIVKYISEDEYKALMQMIDI